MTTIAALLFWISAITVAWFVWYYQKKSKPEPDSDKGDLTIDDFYN